jgi:hypothetical protein
LTASLFTITISKIIPNDNFNGRDKVKKAGSM